MASPSSSDAGESELCHLFCAASLGDFPLFKKRVTVLQKLGLKIENIKDEDGQNALHVAAAAGATQICRYLVKEVKLDIDSKDGDGNTPLHAAILGEHFATAIYLLENGANPNAASNLLRTSLHYAAEKVVTGPKKLLKLLITKGAEVNAVADVGTPLVQAAFRGNKDFVKILLDNKAEVNVISYQLTTPLLSSILTSSIECVKLLLKREYKLNEYYLMAKLKGEEAFNRKDYHGAIKWYTEAYHCKQTDAAMCSNKSLCWTRLNEGGLALQEATACILLRPDWPKAYHRKGAALMLLKDFKKAADVFYQGWMLDIKSKELECAFREAIEAQRNKQKSSSEIIIE
ncbi:hypothetical protein SLEP1_g928 [Rubroshorea leprosula]|uniref:Uncharacterized protein n=1 Tax=Rubroshorea leprosula TaxID=152421 RepID=A0AAV5HN09_9ROSI|nr:hypothetical protein SLEP1_g928 [Rubroshorea leprosula]